MIPHDNEKDLEEIPVNVKKALEIVPVRTIDEVLAHVLTEAPKPLSIEKSKKIKAAPPEVAENKGEDVIRH